MGEYTEPYEVYALRYAVDAGRSAGENFMCWKGNGVTMPLDFYLWVIRNSTRTIVVDTGFSRETGLTRGRTMRHCPLMMLSRLGIDALAVEDVILTHMHYDHAGNLSDLPAARLHLQAAEMSYCTGLHMRDSYLRRAYEPADVSVVVHRLHRGELDLHEGSWKMAPGVSVHLVGGHTPGMQVVRVFTARGWVVLASDAIHYWSNIRQRNPFPIVVDMPAMMRGYILVESLADGPEHIIPGHDPEVRTRFPCLPGMADIACLHEEPRQQAGNDDDEGQAVSVAAP